MQLSRVKTNHWSNGYCNESLLFKSPTNLFGPVHLIFRIKKLKPELEKSWSRVLAKKKKKKKKTTKQKNTPPPKKKKKKTNGILWDSLGYIDINLYACLHPPPPIDLLKQITQGGKASDSFNQNFGTFRSETQWIGSVQPEKFRKNWSIFWGGPVFQVGAVGILVEWIAPKVCVALNKALGKQWM